jgi:hypothetical protein
VHSLDSAHLIKAVLVANAEGIIDIVTVHDCYCCLAPQAYRFTEIIRSAMASMYEQHDPLIGLYERNVGNANVGPPPRFGTLRPRDVERAEYAFD